MSQSQLPASNPELQLAQDVGLESTAEPEGLAEGSPGERKKASEPTSLWKASFRRLLQNKMAVFALCLLAFMTLFSFLGPVLMPYFGDEIRLRIAYHYPTLDHPFGTDEYGRDVLTRVMLAGRISLTIGIASTALSLILGSILGIVSGYFRGWLDAVIMRIADVLMSIPGLPLLIILAALLSEFKVPSESRFFIVVLMLSLIGWPATARLIRGQVLSLREQTFMRATEVLGLSTRSTLFKHLLPNVVPLLIVVTTLGTASGILSESALSFLGLGVMPPTASWGNMLSVATNLNDFERHQWLWIFPGIALVVTVAAINILGDRLRDVLDPKMRKGR